LELDYGPLSVDKGFDRNTSVMYRARASVIDIPCKENKSCYEEYAPNLFVMGTPHELALNEDQKTEYNATTTAMCVEIVGSRFLDSMVRIIVVSKQHYQIRLLREHRPYCVRLDANPLLSLLNLRLRPTGHCNRRICAIQRREKRERPGGRLHLAK
jgi:hypothetical protein